MYHRGLIERNIETARRRLAAEFGCDPEEIAITRNASESLQIAQNGLDLKPGDEIITTEQDYGRMLTTWDQRARRDKITITRLNFPVPTTQDDLYRALREGDHAADEGAALLPHHQPDGTALPGAAISAAWRAQRGITTIVDGAHAARALPVQAARPRDGLLRRQPAQVAARADRHRLPLRAEGSHRVDLAAAGGARAARQRHPQVRGDRHQSRGHESGASTRRSPSSRRSASSARRRGCAT